MAACTPFETFSDFSAGTLESIMKHENLNSDEEHLSSKKIVEVLAMEVEDIGVKQIIAQLSKVQLESFVEPLLLDVGEGNPSKVVIQKRLFKKIVDMGCENAMDKHMTVDQLRGILTTLNATPVGNKKDDLVEQVLKMIHYLGMTTLMNR